MVKSSSMVASVVGASDCPDCFGQPPPHFGLPPPPRPPYLRDLSECSHPQLLDIKTCNAIPVIDAEYHSSPVLPSLGLIVVCSILLLGIFLIVSTLLWKHKKKIQNFSPCKSSPQNRCDVPHGNNVIYEDLTNICPRQLPQQPLPLNHTDLKNPGVDLPYHLPMFACPPRPQSNGYPSQDPYNPIYEELSYGSRDRDGSESEGLAPQSDDEFAEDELSIGEKCGSNSSSLHGSQGNEDACVDYDMTDLNLRNRYMPRKGYDFSLPMEQNKRVVRKKDHKPGSIDRIHVRSNKQDLSQDILLNAFLQYHPVRTPYTLPVGSSQCDVPSYQTRQELTTFRPSQDSDSGYSHNTFGGRGSSRGRPDYHLPYSLDFVLS